MSMKNRSRSRARLLIAAWMVVAAAGVTMLCAIDGPPAAPSAPAAEARPAAPGAEPARAGRRMPGDLAEYALSLDAELSYAAEALPAGATNLRHLVSTRTQGRLAEQVVELLRAHTVSLLRVEAAHVVHERGQQRDTAVEAALDRGILVERDERGTITRARLPLGLDRTGATAVLALADVMQGVLPRAGQHTWTAAEVTSEGTRQVRYVRLGSGPAFEKRIERAAQGGSETVVTGQLQGAWDEHEGTLRELRGKETHVRAGQGGKTLALAELQIALTRVGNGRDPARAAAALAAVEPSFGPWRRLDDPLPAEAGDERAALAVLVGGRSLEDLLGLIARADSDPQAEQDARRALWAYLRLHPEAGPQLAGRAARQKPSDLGARIVVAGLVRAGNAPAQAGLREVAEAWRNTEAALPIVLALGSVAAPSPQTEAFLRTLQGDAATRPELARIGTVALGDVADRVRGSDPERADAIGAELERLLRSSEDAADVVAGLAALGNARSERARELAPPYLSSSDPQIRRMAVFALARSPGDTAHEALRRVAANDPDESVRHEAERALGG